MLKYIKKYLINKGAPPPQERLQTERFWLIAAIVTCSTAAVLAIANAYKFDFLGTKHAVNKATPILYEFAIAHRLITEGRSNQYLEEPFMLTGPHGRAAYVSSQRDYGTADSSAKEYQELYLKYKEELDEVIRRCGLDIQTCHPHVLAYMNMIFVAKTLPIESRIALVNGFVNYVLSYDTSEIPKKLSERYTLVEAIIRSGAICDRNAMLKLDALTRAGVSEKNMAWIKTEVYKRETWPSAYSTHAAVLVRVNGNNWVLNNQDADRTARSPEQLYLAFRLSSTVFPDYAFLNTPDGNGKTPDEYAPLGRGVWQVPTAFFNASSRGKITKTPNQPYQVKPASHVLSLPTYDQATLPMIALSMQAHEMSKAQRTQHFDVIESLLPPPSKPTKRAESVNHPKPSPRS